MMFGVNARKAQGEYVKNKFQLDYWREDNRNATFPRISMVAGVNGENNRIESTFYLRNAAFLRLKNLSLTYDFKHKLLKSAKWLSTCQVSLTGSNLFTILVYQTIGILKQPIQTEDIPHHAFTL